MPSMSESLPPYLDEVLSQAAGGKTVGLRERKKIAAMRRIQRVAIEQFEDHGFAQVTIEHIAEEAEVSPSTVYRYFGTKEDLVIRDEYDELVLGAVTRLFAEHDPWTAFEMAMEFIGGAHFVGDGDLSLRRIRIWYETPSVRAAGFIVLDETAKQLAVLMHAADRYGRSLRDYEILGAAMLAGIFACLEHWYLDGGSSDLKTEVIRALELTRPAWAIAEGDEPAASP